MVLPLLRRGTQVLVRQTPHTRVIAPSHRISPCLLRLMSNETPKTTESSKPSGPLKLPRIKENLAQEKTPISWKHLGIAVVVFGILLEVLWYLKKKRREDVNRAKVFSVGKAAIGGDFELIDTSKRVVTNKDFLGKWILIYFGFTHCPDICPEELEKMAVIVDSVGQVKTPAPLQPLFISVDPERDTPELIAKYTVDFHPRLQGLTGTIEQIKDICKKYRIYYSAGPKEDGDYIVDHTIIMYLLNPKGEFEQYYGRNKTAPEITKDIVFRMNMFKE